jgi:acylphosphatase
MSFAGARIIIKGYVQGVGFRYFVERKAGQYGLNGYVGNRGDGSVEVVCEGERGMVEEFIKDLKVGPSLAEVTDISVDWYQKPEGYKSFQIKLLDMYD